MPLVSRTNDICTLGGADPLRGMNEFRYAREHRLRHHTGPAFSEVEQTALACPARLRAIHSQLPWPAADAPVCPLAFCKRLMSLARVAGRGRAVAQGGPPHHLCRIPLCEKQVALRFNPPSRMQHTVEQ